MRSTVQRAREYELMTIFAPDVPEEELQGAVDRVSAIVTGVGGTVTLINRESPWGRRRLAYPIRHNSRDVRDGIYVLYYFESDPTKVVEIERDLRLTDNVIRYMVTQQVAAPMAPPAPEGEAETTAAPQASTASEAPEASTRLESPSVPEAAQEPAATAEDAPAAAADEAPAVPETAGDEPATTEPRPDDAPASTDEAGEDSGTES